MESVELVNDYNVVAVHPDSFRVRFWSVPEPGAGENLTEYRLTGEHQVARVLEWVRKERAGRRVEVFVEHTEICVGRAGDEPTTVLIQIAGTRPLL